MKPIITLLVFLTLISGCSIPGTFKESRKVSTGVNEEMVNCNSNIRCYWNENVKCVNEEYGNPELTIDDLGCECDLKMDKCVVIGVSYS